MNENNVERHHIENRENRAKLFSALADPTRLRMVDLLIEHGRLSGVDLAEKASISLALMSHHWNLLDNVGLITREKIGQTTYCSINRNVLEDGFKTMFGADES